MLRPLLAQVEAYLGGHPQGDTEAARLGAATGALLGSSSAESGYRSVASLAEEVTALRQGLCNALVFVQKQTPQQAGSAPTLHDAILRYIVGD